MSISSDIYTPAKRSQIMSRVSGRNTAPELAVRRLLHRFGFRFRLHVTDLPGKPDIVLPRFRQIVLVHGCFWHQHPACKRAKRPATRSDWWRAKLLANVERDRKNMDLLKLQGWSVLVVWECQTKTLALLQA